MSRLAGVAFALASFASAASASALPPVYDAWADSSVAQNVDPTFDDANRVRPVTSSETAFSRQSSDRPREAEAEPNRRTRNYFRRC